VPIYRACDVDEQPEICLERWSIRQTGAGNRHFVGVNVKNGDGRVSSRIVELDCARRIGVTESGRRYRLLGRAGYSSDAEYVWNLCVRYWPIESWEDVTPALIHDWRRGITQFDERGKPGASAHDSMGGEVDDDAK
jgi:hypothetical protein